MNAISTRRLRFGSGAPIQIGEEIVTAKLAVIAVSATVLVANAASAQHRAAGKAHTQPMPHVFGQTYGYAQSPAPPDQQRRTDRPYESDAGDHHWYVNPDRLFPVPPHE